MFRRRRTVPQLKRSSKRISDKGMSMKYICFGYLDVENWEKKSESERNAMIDSCFAYDAELKKNSHWVSGEALQGPESATTLHYQNGKVSVTDGPYAETKELLGGLLIIEARDL